MASGKVLSIEMHYADNSNIESDRQRVSAEKSLEGELVGDTGNHAPTRTKFDLHNTKIETTA